ncbi:EpsG family protein [Vibrio crassostreae]|uniref:EpsG family protein n=1 Tax=Vibrio crassostreae TaxID=246167 RepID=UPI00104393C6|nr:EpsG family protein [Vibrio crassostreae]TCN93851.1 EpsG-like putative glucosyltransferase [Vibrio crassostreae]CAK2010888.1 putative EpsG-like glucosyltransferase [Vibrio crassostreae]CAK2015925.1 putative EpsG-like glucosyltransferase [Vibrio crassostreae]CAK2019431.1 putative EpsG-like glucosyltransferase [Vibrio crassostreae]CAK2802190.1 putative EpsG-like glucosyltransferase [Vibrio crassostreae]
MSVYIFFFLALVLVSLFEWLSEDRNVTNLLCIYIIIGLSLLVALRVDVGTDYSSYIGIFEKVKSDYISSFSGLETGFVSSISLFKSIGLNVHFHFGVFSFISLMLIFYVSVKETKYVAIVLLIYFCDLFFYYNLSGFRQSIAMGFVFLSFIFIKDKKPLMFICSILFAALFHKPAIVSLILYPMIWRLSHRIFYCACLLIPIVIQILILSGVFDFIDSLNYFRSTSLYVSDGYNNSDFTNLVKGSIKRLFPIILLFIMLALKIDIRGVFKSSIFKIYFFALMTYLSLYYSYPDLTVRLTSYWFVFMSLAIAVIFNHIKPRFHLFFLALIYAYSFVSIYVYLSLDVYQYKTIGIF